MIDERENLKFPEGFLWGAATASYQIEGGIENNDWAEAGRRGRVPLAGKACDSYNRYEEDFDIVKSLNHNAHRFSIEWARVEPEEGKFDETQIEHYRKVIEALKTRGLEPFVTLWHFTLPIWFAEKGGFLNPAAPEIFARYCKKVVEAMGDKVKFWMTINEPLVYASNGFRIGNWPPFKKNFLTFIKIINSLVTSHNLAYEKIKAVSPSTQIGIAKNLINFESNYNLFNHLLSSFLNWFWNQKFVHQILLHQDFIGVNYYFHRKFGSKSLTEKSDLGWEIYPKGLYSVIISLKKYHRPIYITENGLADATDTRRAKYIRDHLGWVWQAIHDGIDVRGYFHWSLLDNFEWAHGFEPRFGLVEINYQTLERQIRPSALTYAEICGSNILEI